MSRSNGPLTVKPPPTHTQIPLIDLLPDKPITRAAEARTRYGRIVEEIACSLLNLTDIPNSGNYDVVFDAYRGDSYYEIKSVKATSAVPLYDWRRTKDRECGVNLIYAVVVHRCGSHKEMSTAWQEMARTIKEVFLLPAWSMDLLAHDQTLHTVSTHAKHGSMRTGYKNGYRLVPVRRIRQLMMGMPVRRTTVVHGLSVSADVFTHASLP